MSLPGKERLKRIFRRLPDRLQSKYYWIASKLLNHKLNARYHNEYLEFEKQSIQKKQEIIFGRVRRIAIYAQKHNKFYKNYYRDHNFDAESLQTFSDIRRIPIVSKALLRANYSDWLDPQAGARQANTGGTSGSPLTFYIEGTSDVRELAYFDHVWGKLGYRRWDRRAVFRGIDIGDKAWIYHGEGDAYCINQYRPWHETACDLDRLFKSRTIKYLHGYPSAIYSFAKYCAEGNSQLLKSVKSNLRGVFLGSEYPAELYRKVIDDVFQVPSISWYGHSERCVLAAEMQDRYRFSCFHSYGHAEAVELDGSIRLVGTSYDNYSSPFIRYDTGDSIDPSVADGLLLSFVVKNARIGDFILDSKGHPVPLTALIFGRHHKAFDIADFLQISQPAPGRAVLHITTSQEIPDGQIMSLFDLSNVDVAFEYRIRNSPYRTALGKVPLLIPAGTA